MLIDSIKRLERNIELSNLYSNVALPIVAHRPNNYQLNQECFNNFLCYVKKTVTICIKLDQ